MLFKNPRFLVVIVIGAALIGLTWRYLVSYRVPESDLAQPKKIGQPKISPPTSPPPTEVPSSSPIPEGAMMSEVQKFTVEGSEFNFSPKAIHVKKGAEVELTFKNNGTISHNYIVSDLGIATKTIGAGKTDVVKFTAPKTAGTVQYISYCSLPGHREAGMAGTLIVE